MTIGERIKMKRLENGFSVDELASKLGKNRATIYRYENGDIENFPTTILEPLSKILGTTPAFLLGIEDNLNEDTDFIAKMMKDSLLISHVKLLLKLDKADRENIYDMAEFIAGKKGINSPIP